MRTSQEGIDLIKQFEGCRLVAYVCPAGRLTIGYGHTGGVTEHQEITMEQAEAYLKDDLRSFEKAVCALYPAASQREFDALVSLAYNAGIGAVSGGLYALIKRAAGSTAIRRWWESHYITAKGKRLAGLVKRRKTEAALYFKKG